MRGDFKSPSVPSLFLNNWETKKLTTESQAGHMGLCASGPSSLFPWNMLRGVRLPVFTFYNYGFNIWIFLYVLAPHLLPYMRIPILVGKNNTISSSHGFRGRPKVWLSTAKGLRKQEAAHLWQAFIISLVGQGTLALSCLGFPMQGKGKKKNKFYSELHSNIQVTTLLLSSPHPRPHTCTCTSRHACLPANAEEVTDLIAVLVIFQRKMS